MQDSPLEAITLVVIKNSFIARKLLIMIAFQRATKGSQAAD